MFYYILVGRGVNYNELIFGDYQRDVVIQERRDYLDSGGEYKAKDLRVIKCLDDTQAAVDIAVTDAF